MGGLNPIHRLAEWSSFRQGSWHMNVHGRTPANSSAIGRNERVSREKGREGLRLLKAGCKKVWEVVAVGRRRHPSVYSASIPRIVPVLIMQKSSEATEFSLQTFIIVCPGRGTEARRHTSTHTGTHKLSIMKGATVFGGREGLSVSVCTGRGHSRGHGRCQGGRGTIIAAPPLSSLFVASLRRERPSLPIRRSGFCLRFMSVACLLHQA